LPVAAADFSALSEIWFFCGFINSYIFARSAKIGVAKKKIDGIYTGLFAARPPGGVSGGRQERVTDEE
jgi:hypothetical protein